MEIDLALNNEVEDFKEDYESIYLEIIKEACKQLDIHDDLELSVIFVDDQRIHEINKEYSDIVDIVDNLEQFAKGYSNRNDIATENIRYEK